MPHPLSLTALRDEPPTPLAEALWRAQRVVSDRTGIVSDVIFEELAADDLPVHIARSRPADATALAGQHAWDLGTGVSIEPDRAIIKAVGESIERYCSSQYAEEELQWGTSGELGNTVPLEHFALFSPTQYLQAGFPRAPLTPDTPARWVLGYSMTSDSQVYLPATFVYAPYRDEGPRVWDPITTGLGCATNLATALYKALLEAIERDAFMIVWQNRLSCPQIDLASIRDSSLQRLLRIFDRVPFTCHAFSLTLDVPASVILIILTNKFDQPPLTVVGMGTDLDPRRALALALEETGLGLYGMRRLALENPGYTPLPDYSDITTLDRHGLAHAVVPELRSSMRFLTDSAGRISMDDLPNHASDSMFANVRTLVEGITREGLDVIALDLTTADVNEVGFKVVRAVVPGFQALDINHNLQHLGGTRLFDVPVKLGLSTHALAESELNPFPHPFL